MLCNGSLGCHFCSEGQPCSVRFFQFCWKTGEGSKSYEENNTGMLSFIYGLNSPIFDI